MEYSNTIPKATDVPATSQAKLLANFVAIKQLVDVNHATFSDANEGKHKYVSFPEQSASPDTLVDEIALFSRESSLTGAAELCIRKESSGTIHEIAYGTTWARLASGLLIKWGSSTANGLTTITFPVAANIPAFVACYHIQLTNADAGVADSDTAIRLIDNTNLVFRAYGSARITSVAKATGFNYFAIGI